MPLSWFKQKSPLKSNSVAPRPAEETVDIGILLPQAVAHHNEGRLDAAAAIYRRILLQESLHFEATHLLGVIALQQGNFGEAQKLIQSALETNPTHVGARNNLGAALAHAGLLEEAYDQFERVLALQPDEPGALRNLASALCQLGRFAESIAPLRKALVVNPRSAELCGMLGASLLAVGDAQGACDALVQTVKLAPRDVNAYKNLATAYFESGNADAAVDAFKRVLMLGDAGAPVHHAYGNALMAVSDATKAMLHYRRAIALEPERANAHWALAMAQVRPLYDNVQDIQASRQAFAKAIRELDAWFTPSRLALGMKAVGSTQPFYLAYQIQNNLELLKPYGQLCARLVQNGAKSLRIAALHPQRKLRIGIVSAQVRNHSVWTAITKGWIEHLDPSRFEVHIFHLSRHSDEETAYAQREATNFVDTPRTLEDWSQTIRDAQMDVLIFPEIGMDTLTTQLAAQRLAPVQAASWGHPHTTGLPSIDLFLSAELLEPALGDTHYSEKLIRLPNLGVCVVPLKPVVVTPDWAALQLPGNEPLLLCPGVPFKYSCEHDDVWAVLGLRLQKCGSGRLVFFGSHREGMAQKLEKRLRAAFKRAKVDFDRTVCIVPTLPRGQFYGLMQHATLMLDTIGFSGFNTALQSLECGLPVVAYEGEFMRGRLASALLRRMDLNDWVAVSKADFVDKAMRLVEDAALRQELRQTIEERRTILFNDLAPVRALEHVLLDAVVQAARH